MYIYVVDICTMPGKGLISNPGGIIITASYAIATKLHKLFYFDA